MLKRLIISGLLLLQAGFFFAQTGSQTQYNYLFQSATRLYNESLWREAANEFLVAQAYSQNELESSEALYWSIMAQLADADFSSALKYMDELEKLTPGKGRSIDIIYHRARVFFIMELYEDAVLHFLRYGEIAIANNRETIDRKAASYYWAAECLYLLGQIEKAEEFFNWIVFRFPGSPKSEVAAVRLEVIKQKKIEMELLALLRWSHEDALKTNEDFQRKIRTYEHTINSYHKRISDLSQDSRVSDLEETNSEINRKLAEAQGRINFLENELAEYERREKEQLLQKARQLRNHLQWDLENLLGEPE